MDDFIKMDVFFVVATLGVIAFSVLGSIALWRINRILKHVEHVSEQVALESELLREDIGAVRKDIRAGKGKIKSLFGFLKKLGQPPRAKAQD